MSTNTTNTNNGSNKGSTNGTSNGGRPRKTRASKLAGGSVEGARYYPFGTIPLPDPATLERLANEFFLAMPKDLANGHDIEESDSSPEVGSEEIPTVMFTEEMLPPQLSNQRSPGFESAPSMPGSAPSSQPGPLTESDLKAIAAS